jgi:hypothetical protein
MPRPKTPPPTAESLIARIRAVARKAGRSHVTRKEFLRATGISRYHIVQAIGSYDALLAAAGLDPRGNSRVDDDALLRALRDACLKAGGIVGRIHASRFGAHTAPTYTRRWGRWRGVLRALRAWVETNDPGFAYLADLPLDGTPAPPAQGRPPAMPGLYYGAPLAPGPLQHEPTNELGVLVLFGALATQLGFTIERVTQNFPDCEAKRRVDGGWQRVRIEFEYQSRYFQRHGHDPAACDLIVCWEHNWPEAPLEVLELKQKVATA